MGCGSSSQDIEFDDSEFYAVKPEGERFDEKTFINNAMHVVSWLPANDPVGIILISHGVHEHILRYHNVAHACTAVGLGVYGPDHYAHGKSRGTRGLIEDYQILVDEFIQFADWVRAKHPNVPFFVIGHSMGSLVVLASIRKIPYATSMCISGIPLVSGPAASSPFGLQCLYPLSQTSFAISLGAVMSSIDPKGPLAPVLESGLTTNQEVLARLPKDPHRYPGWLMNKTGYEILRLIAVVKVELPLITLPLLCIHGEDDSICKVRGAHQLMDTIGTVTSSKQIRIYPGARHELFEETEPTASDSVQRVISFFQSFLNGNAAFGVPD